MNKQESKYFNTASLMDEALLLLPEEKDYDRITVKEICKKAGVRASLDLLISEIFCCSH